MNPKKYIIYSISNSPYQVWQADLLDYSFLKVKQPGTLIRLCSEDAKYPNREIPISKAGITLTTPNYSKITPDLDWPIMNKVGSLSYIFNKKYFRDEDTLIFLDPDMIFLKPWDPEVQRGTAYGQKWKGYGIKYCQNTSIQPELCPDSEDECLMYPFAIKAGDMQLMIEDIEYFATQGYMKHNDWMADMSAFVIAMVNNNIKTETIENIGLCSNWDNCNDEDAPIMHYCKPILDKFDKEIWGKWVYRPWEMVPDSSQATNKVDRELLQLLREYILSMKQNSP